MMHRYIACLLLLLCVSCNRYAESDLVGHWQGTQLTEEGAVLAVNPEEIQFHFSDKGEYEFQSTLKYREKGSYYIDGAFLVTMDTMNQASVQKSVAILALTTDSLHLLMEDHGRERLLKFARTQ